MLFYHHYKIHKNISLGFEYNHNYEINEFKTNESYVKYNLSEKKGGIFIKYSNQLIDAEIMMNSFNDYYQNIIDSENNKLLYSYYINLKINEMITLDFYNNNRITSYAFQNSVNFMRIEQKINMQFNHNSQIFGIKMNKGPINIGFWYEDINTETYPDSFIDLVENISEYNYKKYFQIRYRFYDILISMNYSNSDFENDMSYLINYDSNQDPLELRFKHPKSSYAITINKDTKKGQLEMGYYNHHQIYDMHIKFQPSTSLGNDILDLLFVNLETYILLDGYFETTSSKFEISSIYKKSDLYSRKFSLQYIDQSMLSGSENFREPGMKSICPIIPFCPNYDLPFKYLNTGLLGISFETSIPLFNSYYCILSMNQLIPVKIDYLFEFEDRESLIIDESNLFEMDEGSLYGLGNLKIEFIKNF